jgi:ribonucleoside-diphosphate reductase alpha chain
VIEPALYNLGYKGPVIDEILAYIKANGTIHGAPKFEEKHGPVFAESLGAKAMSPEAHIDMMAAVQPFLSGGISKTVNMPSDCTPDDIARIYMRAWKSGLKCVAVFRDGCKLSQPISTSLTDTGKKEKKLAWGERKKLPDTRPAQVHKFAVAGQEGYIVPGEYADGTLAEIFVHIAQAGSTLHGILDAWATTISIGLQYGVPFSVLRDKHTGMRFEPSGITSNSDIPLAKSVPDYIFRWLDMTYGDKVDEIKNVTVVEQPKVPDSTSYDGPPCSECGNLTKRAGSCYCCTSCGTTTGCS